MTLSTRTLTQTLAALAIAASTVSGVLYGATAAAYACHVDCASGLQQHGHRAGAHISRSHARRQFSAYPRLAYLRQLSAHPPCILCEPHGPR